MIKACDILIPNKEINLEKFACVACDQFTGDKEYWQSVESTVGDAPSAYRMIFPEIYLGKNDDAKTESINRAMTEYLKNGVFTEIKDTMLYIERTLFDGRVRKGIVCAVDLECYDYSKATRSLIRPTEGTIEQRLPARVKIRQNAPLELPHIMLLMNDENQAILEQLHREPKQELYSSNLMQNGGSIKGWRLTKAQEAFVLEALKKIEVGNGENVIALAVGDGNHSLATAKKCWEAIKPTLTDEEKHSHPARFALCEIVNLHDSSLDFEPIHRILYDVDVEKLVEMLKQHESADGQKIEMIIGTAHREIRLAPTHTLAVGTLQKLIDEYLSQNDGTVDYIHEPEQVEKNAQKPNSVGLLVSGLEKAQLFSAVLNNGALPRKTFSMGMGRDKRYYLEARKIR